MGEILNVKNLILPVSEPQEQPLSHPLPSTPLWPQSGPRIHTCLRQSHRLSRGHLLCCLG